MSGTVCDNRRHIIVPLKSRVSNCSMGTETFAANFEPNILRLVGLLDLRSPKKCGNTCVVSATLRSQTVTDRYRSYGNQALERSFHVLVLAITPCRCSARCIPTCSYLYLLLSPSPSPSSLLKVPNVTFCRLQLFLPYLNNIAAALRSFLPPI